jgi:betaine-aldehyde dehydrogenase
MLMTDFTQTTQPTASHYINGKYVETAHTEAFESIYPATGEVIATLHVADQTTLDQAVAAAKAAQKVWAKTPAVERGRILRRAADIIRERNQALSELETYDTGKPIQETLYVDPTSAYEALEYFGGIAASITGEHIDLGDSFAYTRREPIGVCGAVGAWNYPIQIACWKAAPALACGNSMVFKPSELTPLTALKVAEILTEAGLPDGVFNVVQGFGAVGAELVSHPQVDKVSLTGSVATGKRVMQAASESLKAVTLELGGKSPLIIFEDADIENAISGAMLGNYYSSGQVCSNGTRVFVHKSIKQAFISRLKERAENMILGDPMDMETHMGPLVSQTQCDKVRDYIRIGQREGATLAFGGGDYGKGEQSLYVEPTAFTDVTDDMRIAREEIFGPVMCILDFEEEAEVIARANALDVGLSAGVFTKDIQRGHRVVAELQAGTCWINNYNLAPVEVPFGGVKQSGIGRENSKAAIEHYTQLKSVYVEMGDVDCGY